MAKTILALGLLLALASPSSALLADSSSPPSLLSDLALDVPGREVSVPALDDVGLGLEEATPDLVAEVLSSFGTTLCPKAVLYHDDHYEGRTGRVQHFGDDYLAEQSVSWIERITEPASTVPGAVAKPVATLTSGLESPLGLDLASSVDVGQRTVTREIVHMGILQVAVTEEWARAPITWTHIQRDIVLEPAYGLSLLATGGGELVDNCDGAPTYRTLKVDADARMARYPYVDALVWVTDIRGHLASPEEAASMDRQCVDQGMSCPYRAGQWALLWDRLGYGWQDYLDQQAAFDESSFSQAKASPKAVGSSASLAGAGATATAFAALGLVAVVGAVAYVALRKR